MQILHTLSKSSHKILRFKKKLISHPKFLRNFINSIAATVILTAEQDLTMSMMLNTKTDETQQINDRQNTTDQLYVKQYNRNLKTEYNRSMCLIVCQGCMVILVATLVGLHIFILVRSAGFENELYAIKNFINDLGRNITSGEQVVVYNYENLTNKIALLEQEVHDMHVIIAYNYTMMMAFMQQLAQNINNISYTMNVFAKNMTEFSNNLTMYQEEGARQYNAIMRELKN